MVVRQNQIAALGECKLKNYTRVTAPVHTLIKAARGLGFLWCSSNRREEPQPHPTQYRMLQSANIPYCGLDPQYSPTRGQRDPGNTSRQEQIIGCYERWEVVAIQFPWRGLHRQPLTWRQQQYQSNCLIIRRAIES